MTTQDIKNQVAVEQAAEQVITAVHEAKKQTGRFGPNKIGMTTPNWATWMFRIYFYVAQFIGIIFAFVTQLPAQTKVDILGAIAIANIAVHGFSKMWGIDTKKIQQEAVDAFTQAQEP